MRTMRRGGWGVYDEPRMPDVRRALALSAPLLRLLWSPFSLAHVAAKVDTRVAAGAGICAVTLLVGLHGSSFIHGVEPFRDIPELFRVWLEFALFVAIALAVALGVPTAIIAGLAHLVRRSHRPRVSPLTEARERALFLAPVFLITPMAAWSLAAALHGAAAPNCEFYGPAGKPAWLASPFLAVAGNRAWAPALVAFGAIVSLIASARLGNSVAIPLRQEAGAACPTCGYSLVGLHARRCPECGVEGQA